MLGPLVVEELFIGFKDLLGGFEAPFSGLRDAGSGSRSRLSINACLRVELNTKEPRTGLLYLIGSSPGGRRARGHRTLPM
jgi:hypothetical protein